MKFKIDQNSAQSGGHPDSRAHTAPYLVSTRDSRRQRHGANEKVAGGQGQRAHSPRPRVTLTTCRHVETRIPGGNSRAQSTTSRRIALDSRLRACAASNPEINFRQAAGMTVWRPVKTARCSMHWRVVEAARRKAVEAGFSATPRSRRNGLKTRGNSKPRTRRGKQQPLKTAGYVSTVYANVP